MRKLMKWSMCLCPRLLKTRKLNSHLILRALGGGFEADNAGSELTMKGDVSWH